MNKDWLIRTRQKKLLGPISREKLIELIEKGSLAPEDQVCSGNGYWIYVKEQDLVQKYIYDNCEQDFNPIAEAADVLCNEKIELEENEVNEDEEVSSSNNSLSENTVCLNLDNSGIKNDDNGELPKEEQKKK